MHADVTRDIPIVTLYAMLGDVKKPYIAVNVYYGTDRKPDFSGGQVRYDENAWSSDMEYGVAEVSIPKSHRPGKLERPAWWRLEFREDPAKHVVLRGIARFRKDAFFSSIGTAHRNAQRAEIFLFVHGFNVGFEDAMRRTAQLAYDLRIEGIAVAYTWPSSDGMAGYMVAENNSLKAVPHFVSFVQSLREQSAATTINVLAHSMGNRIVLDGMRRLANVHEEPLLNHVLLAAPDVDVDVFREILPSVISGGSSSSTSVYASSGDRAIALSEELHGSPRAGGRIVIVSGLDTIDASDLDLGLLGHSYYADRLIQDMFYVLRHSLPAADRHLLPRSNEEGAYWALP